MRTTKLIFAIVALFAFVACDEQEEKTTYPAIESLMLTEWDSTSKDDNGGYLYHTLSFESESAGTLTTYDKAEGGEEVDSEVFTYTFNGTSASLIFATYGRYDGYIIPKGEITVDYKDVYILQLFHVDDQGKPIVNDNGEYDAMMFWRE